MQNSNLQLTADKMDHEITMLDMQIAELRKKKQVVADERKGVLAEIEIMAKLGNLSDEQRKRIVINPNPVSGRSAAAK